MKYSNPTIESSYRTNNIGKTLYDIVIALRPKKILEFGVLNGYSTVAMAMALHELGQGKIYAVDMWDQYPYKHGNRKTVQETIKNYGLEEYVVLQGGDFYKINPAIYADVEMLHVDISNTAETIDHAARFAHPKCRVFFEGGTQERDEVKWMKQYNKTPIRLTATAFRVIDNSFPALSMITL